MIRFKEFMDMYDNWNGVTVVNDNWLNPIVKDRTLTIIETRQDLFEKEVVAFGFYDGEFCVRVKDPGEGEGYVLKLEEDEYV